MARPSTIDQLPRDIRELIGQLRMNGVAIDAILNKLKELDVEVSRSALARHTQKIDAIAERVRESRAAADAIMDRLGASNDNRQARLNIELMHANLMSLLSGEDGGDIVLSAQEAMFLGRALKDLAQASKLDQDREIKLREEIAKEERQKAADVVVETARSQGLDEETAAFFRAEILGVPVEGSDGARGNG